MVQAGGRCGILSNRSEVKPTEDGAVYCPAIAKSNPQNTEDGVVYCPAVAKSNSQNTEDEGEGKDEGQTDVFHALGLRDGRLSLIHI